MSIREELGVLARLQSAELTIRRIDGELASLPAEREARRARIAAAKANVQAAEASLSACGATRTTLEKQVQEIEQRVDKYRDQEMLVKTNEELWAIQEQIRQAEANIARLEEQILEQMESADEFNAAILERKAELAGAEKVTAAEIAEIDARQQELEEQRGGVAEQVAEMRDAIAGSDTLRLYDRIASVRDGVGMGEAVDGNCTACNVRLRPQAWLEVMNMEQPVQCDNCKRISVSRAALELPSDVVIGVV